MLGDTLKQRALIDLIGQLVDDDGLTRPFINIFKMCFSPHHHAATARSIALTDPRQTIDDSRSWKIGRRN